MVLRSPAWRQAFSAHIQYGKTCKRLKSSAADAAAPARSAGDGRPPLANNTESSPTSGGRGSPGDGGKPVDLKSLYTSISRNEKQKKSQERDFLVSVLSSSPTKRDTKKYMQTFGKDKTGKSLISPKKLSPGELQLTQQKDQRQPPLQLLWTDGSFSPDTIRSVSESPQFVQGPRTEKPALPADDEPHVAIVKLQDPETIDDATLEGLAKTFVQLRALGLASVIVIGQSGGITQNAGDRNWINGVMQKTLRVAAAIDKYNEPATSVTSLVSYAMALDDEDMAKQLQHDQLNGSRFVPGRVYVGSESTLMQPLQKRDIVLIPPYAISAKMSEAKPVDTDEILLALTRYFAGFQRMWDAHAKPAATGEVQDVGSIASVDRVIVIDPIGGTPSQTRPKGTQVFVNLEEEYRAAKAALDEMAAHASNDSSTPGPQSILETNRRHKANLDIIRNTLSMLPSSSSALLTTPAEAANLAAPLLAAADEADDVFGYVGSVGTRRSQNPLIHNLLTDRPVYSSSLPLGRIKPKAKTKVSKGGLDLGLHVREEKEELPPLSRTTLLKKGMPLTIYPDPRTQPWVPPAPGDPSRLRLTDTCIDLPRLVRLIEDSFGRRLDVQHYLRRVEQSLAGVIIAGEYEGGAILTWERPAGLSEEDAYRQGRLVPYLDKFAVLTKSQGAGGVADIVFTAMVRDCFPAGVCWRSRKDNPVNRWYFERSRGTWKLGGANWTMFWTTPWVAGAGEGNEGVNERRIWDYESVCRSVEPSWADKKHIVD